MLTHVQPYRPLLGMVWAPRRQAPLLPAEKLIGVRFVEGAGEGESPARRPPMAPLGGWVSSLGQVHHRLGLEMMLGAGWGLSPTGS